MIEKELEELRQTEQLCRELIAAAEEERLKSERDAKTNAEKESRRQELEAHSEGEERLLRARLDADERKRAELAAMSEEIERMIQSGKARMGPAVRKIIERMCNGDDCANELLQPSGAEI